MDKIQAIEQAHLRKKIPAFRPGDFVQVTVRIREADGERSQAFEGTVIRRRGRGLGETFTLRKISFGVGVERTFPLHAPTIENIRVLRQARSRRARLYYLRHKSGREARMETVDRTPASEPQPSAGRAKPSPTPEAAPTRA